ncbi:MAG: hypothetical protein QXV17_08280 [Candidatus Micrarchaeaceae archaeon]
MSGIFGATSSYAPLLLSHQTGLSVTATASNTEYAIGSSITVPRNGVLSISMMGHVSGANGYIILKLTRGSNTYTFGSTTTSLFSDYINGVRSNTSYITSTTSTALTAIGDPSQTDSNPNRGHNSFEWLVLSGDVLQFYASNNTANYTVYIDDVLVMLQ